MRALRQSSSFRIFILKTRSKLRLERAWRSQAAGSSACTGQSHIVSQIPPAERQDRTSRKTNGHPSVDRLVSRPSKCVGGVPPALSDLADADRKADRTNPLRRCHTPDDDR